MEAFECAFGCSDLPPRMHDEDKSGVVLKLIWLDRGNPRANAVASVLTRASFERIEFYLPSWVAAQQYMLENRRKDPVLTTIDGFKLLRNLGVQAFNIDARRWHKIKNYISKGKVELPRMSDDCDGILDGRHRTLLIMQIYNITEVPVFYTRDVSSQRE